MFLGSKFVVDSSSNKWFNSEPPCIINVWGHSEIFPIGKISVMSPVVINMQTRELFSVFTGHEIKNNNCNPSTNKVKILGYNRYKQPRRESGRVICRGVSPKFTLL